MAHAAALFMAVGCEERPDPKWIGNYPPLQHVRKGLRKQDVLQILGSPLQKKGKASPKEAWIYSPAGWHGNIEVYFNPAGIVSGMTCGYG